MPEHEIEIGAEAFYGCDCLADSNGFVILRGTLYTCTLCKAKEIAIPEGVVAIDGDAFLGCVCAEHISIASSVRYLCRGAFFSCVNLKDITIPETVQSISGRAFEDCTRMKTVIIQGSELDIAKDAFYHCNNLQYVFAPKLPIAVIKEAKLLKQALAYYADHPEAFYDEDVAKEYKKRLNGKKQSSI